MKPSIQFSQLPEAVWADWESQSLTLDDWNLNFQAVENTDDNLASSDDIKKQTSFLAKADLLKTPAKRKREELLGDTTQQLVSDIKAMRYERVLPREKEELEQVTTYGLKPGVLTSVVSGIEMNLELMSEGLEKMAILTSTRFQANENDVTMLSGIMGNVRTSVGTPVEMDSMFAAPTMWGVMALMADEIIRAGSQVKGSVEAFLPFRALTKKQLGEVKNSSDTTVKIWACS